MCSLLLLSWYLLVLWFQYNCSSSVLKGTYWSILQQSYIYMGKHGKPSTKAIFTLLGSERNIPAWIHDGLRRLLFLFHYNLITHCTYLLNIAFWALYSMVWFWASISARTAALTDTLHTDTVRGICSTVCLCTEGRAIPCLLLYISKSRCLAEPH